MKTSTLFLMGLIVGALVVFLIRAAQLDHEKKLPSTPTPERAAHAHPGPQPSSGSSLGGESTPASSPAPAPAPAPAPDESPTHDPSAASASGGAPENAVCPVMGNAVDPAVFVDYKDRRIGFCCPGCDTLFLKNPEKYLKRVDAELANAKGD